MGLTRISRRHGSPRERRGKLLAQGSLRPRVAAGGSFFAGKGYLQKHQKLAKARENAPSPTTYVRRIARTYELCGLPEKVTNYDNPDVVQQVAIPRFAEKQT